MPSFEEVMTDGGIQEPIIQPRILQFGRTSDDVGIMMREIEHEVQLCETKDYDKAEEYRRFAERSWREFGYKRSTIQGLTHRALIQMGFDKETAAND